LCDCITIRAATGDHRFTFNSSIRTKGMWFFNFCKSSIGRKFFMALSGLLLLAFLAVHAFGNAAIYAGSKYFQFYADFLHNFPVLVLLASVGLGSVLVLHIVLGLSLFLEKRQRTGRYEVYARLTENTFASRTMGYTGLFILLFLIIHVTTFVFAPGSDTPISVVVMERFSSFFFSLFYLVSFIALGVHLNHGFFSMMQTFGFNHPRYDKTISVLTVAVPVAFLVIFGGIPLYFMSGAGASFMHH
jgi:succinate dehydrogenase / fumarate reductase cytochrome b subunit